MNNSFYQLLFYFFIYSFLGWCMEIAYASVKKKQFLNRGVLNGPLCPVYGIGMLLILTFFKSLENNFLFLIIGSGVVATLLEFFTGGLMERLFKKRWWDYSDYKYNLGGYVCLPFSALWGLAAALTLHFIHPFVRVIIQKLPALPGKIILIVAVALLIIDLISVLGIVFEVQKYNQQIEELAEGMHQISNRLARAIFTHIERRMAKAHPELTKPENITEGEIRTSACSTADGQSKTAAVPAEIKETPAALPFAYGCCFHKLVWLFFIGAFLGDITETIFVYVTAGKLMSRSSVVYGPFSIVWGLGVVVLTMMLHRYRDRDDRYIFLFGTVVGGAYEYICSVFTEIAFGTVFWDYSKIPFNLGGRINLLYCFFWGLAAVVWIKILYPRISGLIEKIPKKAGTILSHFLIVFMIINIVVSTLALGRYTDRYAGKEAGNAVEQALDRRFPDERMERIYPNAIIRE